MRFLKANLDGEIWDDEMVSTDIAGIKVLIIQIAGVLYAFEDKCAHKAVPLSDGFLKDKVITCGAHHWQFDAKTGQGVNPKNTCLRQFAVKKEKDGIYIGIEGDDDNV